MGPLDIENMTMSELSWKFDELRGAMQEGSSSKMKLHEAMQLMTFAMEHEMLFGKPAPLPATRYAGDPSFGSF